MNLIHDGEELLQREKTGPDTYPVILPLSRVESAERDLEGALAAEKIREK